MDEKGTFSDWNQQKAFDYVYHVLESECRKLQEKRDVISWMHTIEAIVVHVISILGNEERTKLLSDINELRTKLNNYLKVPDRQKSNSAKLGELYVALFKYNILIRDYVNKHNPFLNKREDESWDNLE